jgi:hypothetical protein
MDRYGQKDKEQIVQNVKETYNTTVSVVVTDPNIAGS